MHRASLTQLAVRFAAEEMARLGVAPATAPAPNARRRLEPRREPEAERRRCRETSVPRS
jgi:hypothetical protein